MGILNEKATVAIFNILEIFSSSTKYDNIILSVAKIYFQKLWFKCFGES